MKNIFCLEDEVPNGMHNLLETLYSWMGKVECYGRIILIFDGVHHLIERGVSEHVDAEIAKFEEESHHYHPNKHLSQIERHGERKDAEARHFFDLFRRHLPRNVRMVFSIARSSDLYKYCSESWNFLGIPRLKSQQRDALSAQYKEVWRVPPPTHLRHALIMLLLVKDTLIANHQALC